ncbi:MAG: Rrf2 family transcriptional regulator [Candidatus Kerfeldbacteria bacterium]|nr:Rrf2 family transcriptional regulator [Candidatus Kerfeldbacteria bacterium]
MFVVPTKIDYGLVVMLALAQAGDQYVSLTDIAHQRSISQKYLSQLIIPLRQAGLVLSREGKGGGYRLAHHPSAITVRQVVEALDGPLQLARCMDPSQHCPANHACKTKPVWQQLQREMYDLLSQKKLADIV